MHKWIATKLLGFNKVPNATAIDIVSALKDGKTVLIDSTLGSPIQRHLKNITGWGDFLNSPTFELWNYDNRVSFEPFKGLEKHRVRHKIDEIRNSIISNQKTVTHINHSTIDVGLRASERMIEAIVETAEELWHDEHPLPLFVIELFWRHENEYTLELLKRLKDITATLVFRTTETSMPTSKISSDIHIVERPEFRKYLRSDAEVLMKCGTRTVISSHPDASRFKRSINRNHDLETTPSISDFNESFLSPLRREEFVRKHWSDLGLALSRC